MEMIKPKLFFQPKIFYIAQDRITVTQAFALSKYITAIQDVPGKKIFRLILHECQLSDEAFSHILDGVLSQTAFASNGAVVTQYLQSLMYSHNSIGVKSMGRLIRLIPNMVELVLENINFVGGKDENGTYFSGLDILDRIVLSTIGLRMMKLKISNNTISNQYLFLKHIKDTLKISKNMILLDLSWSKMCPKDLAKLSYILLKNKPGLRNLNLSYNSLNFS